MWSRKVKRILRGLVFTELVFQRRDRRAELWSRIAPSARPRFIEFEFCVCISAGKAEDTRQLSGIAVNAFSELFGVYLAHKLFGAPREVSDTPSCPDSSS